MSDEPTNRELKLMLDNQEKKFDEKHDDLIRLAREIRDDVKETKAQAQKTNGRVNLHEQILSNHPEQMKNLTDVVFWKKYMLIALGAIWSVILIGFPLLVKYFNSQIKRTVVDSLEEFQFVFPQENENTK